MNTLSSLITELWNDVTGAIDTAKSKLTSQAQQIKDLTAQAAKDKATIATLTAQVSASAQAQNDAVGAAVLAQKAADAAATNDANQQIADIHGQLDDATAALQTKIASIEAPGSPILPVPQSLVATAGDGVVTLSWSPVDGADSYTVQRSLTAGGPHDPPTPATSTTFADTAVSNGQAYFYVVASVFAGVTSQLSSEASATPQAAVPTVPVDPANPDTSTASQTTATAGPSSAGPQTASDAGATQIQGSTSPLPQGSTPSSTPQTSPTQPETSAAPETQSSPASPTNSAPATPAAPSDPSAIAGA